MTAVHTHTRKWRRGKITMSSRIIELADSGHSPLEIAAKLKCDKVNIYMTLRRHRCAARQLQIPTLPREVLEKLSKEAEAAGVSLGAHIRSLIIDVVGGSDQAEAA